MSARALAVALLAVAGLAVAPAGATAGVAPVLLGAGAKPNVLVDAAGTAYIAWADQHGNGPVFFCRLPRGASACANAGPLTFPSALNTFTRPYLLQRPGGGLVLTIDRNFNQEIWQSSDGGATWSPGSGGEGLQIGDVNPGGQAILSPDGSALESITATTTGGVRFQFQPLSGPAQTTSMLFGGYEYDGTLAPLSATQTLAAFWSIPAAPANKTTAFSIYTGTPGTGMNTPGAWGPITQIDSPAADTHLASGAAGVGLLENVGDTGTQLLYRRFSGAAFKPGVTVFSGQSAQEEAVAQDGSGRVHAAWVSPDGLHYARSNDGGDTWEGGGVYVSGSLANSGPQLGAASDGQGWMVYASSGSVYAIPLLESALTGLAAGGGAGGGGGGGGGSGGAGGATVTSSATVSGNVISLSAPSACVRNGIVNGTVNVSLPGAKRKGHVVVKLYKVIFSVGRTRVTVTRAKLSSKPFVGRLRLKNVKPGSKLVLVARAFIAVHSGPQRSKTLRVTLTACA